MASAGGGLFGSQKMTFSKETQEVLKGITEIYFQCSICFSLVFRLPSYDAGIQIDQPSAEKAAAEPSGYVRTEKHEDK